MADRKITGHTAITAAQVDPAADVFEIIDISDTTDAASGTNKKMTVAEVKRLSDFTDRLIGTTLNRRHTLLAYNVNLTTVAATINSLRCYPVLVRNTITIDKIGIEVTTGTTGLIRLMIYDSGSDGGPNNLIAESGELTITAPGTYEGLTVASVTLLPGLYHFAYLTNTANTFRGSGTQTLDPCYGIALAGTFHGALLSSALTYRAAPSPFPAYVINSAVSNLSITVRAI